MLMTRCCDGIANLFIYHRVVRLSCLLNGKSQSDSGASATFRELLHVRWCGGLASNLCVFPPLLWRILLYYDAFSFVVTRCPLL